MNDDWIRMRSDLYRDPKVLVIADDLMRGDGLLARYVNQNVQSDMAVTRNVMRNAVVGALVSVWGVMRRRGKRSGLHLTVARATLSVLDDISEMPGFGYAMAESGWVKEVGQGLLFPRFFETYNTDPLEKYLVSGRERQQRWRDKHKNGTANVTVTAREEKRREENKRKTPPTPKGGESDGFSEFWSAYPKKIGKVKALQAWNKIRPDDAVRAQILAALAQQAKSEDWRREDGRFIPHPTSWLNARRWEDDLVLKMPGAKSVAEQIRELGME